MAATVRNTAVKRIQGDVREMMTNPSDQYAASPLETNMFDWHFTLRGPRDTEFDGGIYHGRIILPSDYPFKPPNIMLLTPNGRFEVKKKICLSISAYHPEEWQPAWGVRLILEALISFMPTKGEGAIGALEFSADERKRLAKLSIEYKCETCGRVADLLPELKSENEDEKTPSKYMEQISQLYMHSLEGASLSSAVKHKKGSVDVTGTDEDEKETAADEEHCLEEAKRTPVVAQHRAETHEDTSKPELAEKESTIDADDSTSTHETVSALAEEAAETPAVNERHQNADIPIAAHDIAQVRESDSVDTLLHYLTVAIVVALFALIYKKLLQTYGVL